MSWSLASQVFLPYFYNNNYWIEKGNSIFRLVRVLLFLFLYLLDSKLVVSLPFCDVKIIYFFIIVLVISNVNSFFVCSWLIKTPIIIIIIIIIIIKSWAVSWMYGKSYSVKNHTAILEYPGSSHQTTYWIMCIPTWTVESVYLLGVTLHTNL